MYTLLILSWIVFIVGEAYTHARLIEVEKERPNYIIVFLIRGMASIVHGVFLDAQNGWHYLDIIIFQCATHWIIFPKLLNELRGKSFWYLGAESGWIDPFLIKHPILHRFLYFWCIPIAVLALLAIRQRGI